MIGLKKLDWYIIRRFMLTFFAAILFIIVIVIIFDLSEKIDDFVKREAPLHAIVFDYYLNFIPYFMNMYSPLFVFITVIFFTSRLAANSEIIAILSCGVSFQRMMVPYIISAVLIALLSLSLSLFVIPHANVERIAFEQKYVRHYGRPEQALRDIHYKLNDSTLVYIESFSTWNNTAYNFTLEQLGTDKLVRKLSAESAQWDSTSASWQLHNWFDRIYGDGLQDRVKSGRQKDTTLSLTVDDFYRNKRTVERLNRRELNELIKVQKERGDKMVMYSEVEKHTRLALPFSAIILTIMGVCLSSKKRRGGTGWNIALGLALGFSYVLFMKFSQMFVATDTLSPAMALWLPNMIYALIAAVIYRLAPK